MYKNPAVLVKTAGFFLQPGKKCKKVADEKQMFLTRRQGRLWYFAIKTEENRRKTGILEKLS